MARLKHLIVERPGIALTIALITAGYIVAASSTHPFTVGADTTTAVPIAVVAALLVGRIWRTRRADPTAHQVDRRAVEDRSGHGSLVWLVLAAAAVSWELYCFTSTPRSEHPTFSTLLDLLDSTRLGKAAGLALWLALGCYLVLR
jgi:hypothetical protein